ncbi:hypothetical protein A9F13_24g00682 [Clavispora lusitaniae]|uniref:DUF3844 domain-containing protein n=1 Tax=Clavispora lusitaniae TaxID=36911 RepID=A0AA91PVM7_CLALS|nr:hypothetical protein A9F13_24g00682 [Clavispora lusitaniae]
MKIHHFGSAFLFGAAVCAQNAAVYNFPLDKQSQESTLVSVEDSVLYFADKAGVSDYYSIGDNYDAIKFLESVGSDDERTERSKLLVIVKGVEEPAKLFGTDPLFEIGIKNRSKESHKLMRALLKDIPQQAASDSDNAKPNDLGAGVSYISPNGALSHEKVAFDDAYEKFSAKLAHGFDIGNVPQKVQDIVGNVKQSTEKILDAFSNSIVQLLSIVEASKENSLLIVTLDLRKTAGSKSQRDSALDALFSQLSGASDKIDTTVVALGAKKSGCHGKLAGKRSDIQASAFAKRGAIAAESCFSDKDECDSSTKGCNNHGSCAEVASDCWQCVCVPSVDKKASKTTKWAGYDCSKKDISSSAHLLLWTSVALLITLAVGTKLLFSVDSEPLPGVLEAATVKRSS